MCQSRWRGQRDLILPHGDLCGQDVQLLCGDRLGDVARNRASRALPRTRSILRRQIRATEIRRARLVEPATRSMRILFFLLASRIMAAGIWPREEGLRLPALNDEGSDRGQRCSCVLHGVDSRFDNAAAADLVRPELLVT
jgi:hypothetical protein